MAWLSATKAIEPARGLLARLARDRAGNTLALVAASLAPLLALVGGGIDMGRSYLSESRLQQACDAGVLAARKRLGAQVVVTGEVPDDVALIGNRFFNANFRGGAYGTEDRDFAMTLEEDYSISGVATVNVPTTIMRIFGYQQVPVRVDCEARINFTHTDVMMVLDTTGSMNQTNPGDSEPKIAILKDVVRSFHAMLEGSKGPGVRIRYGFVPYATNVNVGHLLENDWVVDEWTYQSREDHHADPGLSTYTYYENFTPLSGSQIPTDESTYEATWHPPAGEHASGHYTCDTPAPGSTGTSSATLVSTVTEPYAGPPAGNKVTEHYSRLLDGTFYSLSRTGSTCTVKRIDYANYAEEYDRVTVPATATTTFYRYAPIARDVSNWRSESNGCIEERSTYAITDYANVDFDQALDLDIDRVPTSGDPDTQWRPMYPHVIFERSIASSSSGDFTLAPVVSTATFFQPTWSSSLIACPARARKLAEMDSGAIDNYLSSISASGSTYHDIGMIWGARLISPTGLFAGENANLGDRPTSRHLIFLTDGYTQPFDLAYGAYGVEPLDQRRWAPGGSQSLTETVESRFTVACNEAKKRNLTVWAIGFGIAMTDMLRQCAGDGHWYQADDATQLKDAFDKIAGAIGDLRISK